MYKTKLLRSNGWKPLKSLENIQWRNKRKQKTNIQTNSTVIAKKTLPKLELAETKIDSKRDAQSARAAEWYDARLSRTYTEGQSPRQIFQR